MCGSLFALQQPPLSTRQQRQLIRVVDAYSTSTQGASACIMIDGAGEEHVEGDYSVHTVRDLPPEGGYINAIHLTKLRDFKTLQH